MAEPFESELDWSPESWFGRRIAKPDGTKYTNDDVKSLNSHLLEYLDIERDSKANGTWLNMSDGTKWTGDPRSWVMMLSLAFKKNYSSQPWWTGQARWKTSDLYGDKVTRAPYHNGQMWFSDDEGYGAYFAHKIDSKGLKNRFSRVRNNEGHRVPNPERTITGYNFLAAIPKVGEYRHLPVFETPIRWNNMPFLFKNGRIEVTPNNEIVNEHIIPTMLKGILTDDVVNWSLSLGDEGIFINNVNDGPSFNLPSDKTEYYKSLDNKESYKTFGPFGEKLTPVNEFISLPGFTNKVKFIEGNNGDFDINNPYKYAYNPITKDDILRAFYGAKLNKKDWYAI